MERDKRNNRSLITRIGIALLAGAFSIMPRAEALPTLADGSSVGDVAIQVAGKQMDIGSTVENNVLKWEDFSIGKGETVAFDANNYLNLVTGANASEIWGTLTGAGSIYLINPNGILFGAGSQINVGALYASTRDLPTDDQINAFLNNGTSPLDTTVGSVNADIINCGTLKADTVLLEGNHVSIRNYEDVMNRAGDALLTDKVTIRAAEEGGIHVGFQIGDISENADSTKYYSAARNAPSFGYKGYFLNGTTENSAVGYALINNVYELQSLKNIDNGAYNVGYGNFMLAGDIDASVTSTWNDGAGFEAVGDSNQVIASGHFDGLGYTIKNLHSDTSSKNATAAIFTSIKNVENLKIVGATMNGGTVNDNLVAAVAGSASGTLRNIHVDSTTTLNGRKVGGLVGHASDNLTIKDSDSAATITAASYAGGLVAGGNVGVKLTIQNSHNSGSVTQIAGNDSASGFGGLLGTVSNGTSLTITNSYNEGAIGNESSANAAPMGGLAGYLYSPGKVTLKNVWNTNDVTASGSRALYAGGLIGRANFGHDVTIEKVYNKGNITVTDTNPGDNTGVFGGGLIGRMEVSGVNVTISEAYNGGWDGNAISANSGAVKVTAKINDSNGSGNWPTSHAGGIIGHYYTNQSPTLAITNVYNTGRIQAEGYATDNVNATASGGIIGGLEGANNSNTSISYAYYSGNNEAVGTAYSDTRSYVINHLVDYGAALEAYESNSDTNPNPHAITTYDGWDIGSNGGENKVWRIYNLHTPPMLRAFLKSGKNLAVTKEYNGSAQSISAADLNALGIYTDSNFSSTTWGNKTDAGTYTISYNDGAASSNGITGLSAVTWSGQDGVDYDDINLVIKPKEVTASFAKTYDGQTDVSLTTGVTVNGVLENDTVTLSGTGNYWAKDSSGNLAVTKNAGDNYLVNTGRLTLNNPNYRLAALGSTGQIDPKTLTATFPEVSKTYDGGTSVTNIGTPSLEGVVSGDTVNAAATGATYDSANAGPRMVTYTGVSLSGNDAVNYVLGSNTVTGNGVIQQKDVTLTANPATFTVGEEITGLSGTVTGLVEGDTDNSTWTTTATSSSEVGSYAITGSLANDNYNPQNADANSTALTIKAASGGDNSGGSGGNSGGGGSGSGGSSSGGNSGGSSSGGSGGSSSGGSSGGSIVTPGGSTINSGTPVNNASVADTNSGAATATNGGSPAATGNEGGPAAGYNVPAGSEVIFEAITDTSSPVRRELEQTSASAAQEASAGTGRMAAVRMETAGLGGRPSAPISMEGGGTNMGGAGNRGGSPSAAPAGAPSRSDRSSESSQTANNGDNNENSENESTEGDENA
ncbi:MAG: filamentous hemagglutinin N-terminal domain-containing protein [Selenomonas sp.]|nr:filamentous hemagglutinin N-terminal domain-containing protein [Selenomonas sp.]